MWFWTFFLFLVRGGRLVETAGSRFAEEGDYAGYCFCEEGVGDGVEFVGEGAETEEEGWVGRRS